MTAASDSQPSAGSSENPLGGCRVVVCRAADQAAGLLASVGELGGVGVALPLLELAEPLDGGAALERSLAALDSFDWLLLTSANAVRSVFVRCPQLPASLRLAVVGPATSQAAAQAGWRVSFEPTRATGEALASELPFELVAPRVLAPLAELAADTVERVLQNRGALVERVDAYRMDTPRYTVEQIEAALAADVVLLTSPSTAERFAELAGADRCGDGPARQRPKAVVIGPSTNVAAIAAGLDVVAVADPHTEVGLLDALVRSIGG